MAASGFSSSAMALIFVLSFATFLSSVEGRKLLVVDANQQDNRKDVIVSSSLASLILSKLPKGTTPASSPTKKSHATLGNVELFRRHLRSIDRILQSVPSPGAGH